MYVTNFNLGLVIQSIEMDFSDFVKDPSLVSVLSNDELQKLKKASELFKKKKITVKKIEHQKFVDHYKFVTVKSSQPAYHLDDKCEKLNTPWTSYLIPEVIRARGEAECIRYRNYVGNGKMLDNPTGRLTVCAEFGITDADIGDMNTSEKSVADFKKEIQSMSQVDIKKQLFEIGQKLEKFPQLSAQHKKAYQLKYKEPKEIRYLTQNQSSEMKVLYHELADIKDLYLLLLVEEMKKASGFDQNAIEEDILQQAGFVACKHCL